MNEFQRLWLKAKRIIAFDFVVVLVDQESSTLIEGIIDGVNRTT
jgi:hypothetical protein